MPMDFTVVIRDRQRFGDAETEERLEPGVPFVGREREYDFDCPRVDSGEEALLLFQTQGANARQLLEINGREIVGGIPESTETSFAGTDFGFGQSISALVFGMWTGHVMIVHPGVLRDSNVLRIEATASSGDNVDNFLVDNVVVLFKTRPPTDTVAGGGSTGGLSPAG